MSNLEQWLDELVKSNGVTSKTELTPQMLINEIGEVESAIQNERIWSAGAENMSDAAQHELNASEQTIYLIHLRDLLRNCKAVTEYSLCLNIYSDPDELPFRITFLISANVSEKSLREKLADARDSVDQIKHPDIEEHFFAVLDETVKQFEFGYWHQSELQSLHNRENLWEVK